MMKPYGYQGSNAYTVGSKNVAMYAAGGFAGGTLLGYGSMYMFSSYRSYKSCKYGDQQYSSCQQCYDQYADGCQLYPPEAENASRVDLMETGFWPDDFQAPYHLTISQITGIDYAATRICPPNGTNMSEWVSPDASDTFVVITQVGELAEDIFVSACSSIFGFPAGRSCIGLVIAGLLAALANCRPLQRA